MKDSQFQTLREEILKENPTVAELKSYAAGIGCDLQKITLKDEIADRITIYLTEQRMGNAPAESAPEETTATEMVQHTSDSEPVEKGSEELSVVGGSETEPKKAKKQVTQNNQLKIIHVVRLLIPDKAFSLSTNERMTARQLEVYLAEEYFADEYNLHSVVHLGQEQDGHNLLFVMEDASGAKNSHSEIKVKLQTMRTGITGFQANEWISSYISDGWDLAHVGGVGYSEAGVNIFWVLVK